MPVCECSVSRGIKSKNLDATKKLKYPKLLSLTSNSVPSGK